MGADLSENIIPASERERIPKGDQQAPGMAAAVSRIFLYDPQSVCPAQIQKKVADSNRLRKPYSSGQAEIY